MTYLIQTLCNHIQPTDELSSEPIKYNKKCYKFEFLQFVKKKNRRTNASNNARVESGLNYVRLFLGAWASLGDVCVERVGVSGLDGEQFPFF